MKKLITFIVALFAATAGAATADARSETREAEVRGIHTEQCIYATGGLRKRS